MSRRGNRPSNDGPQILRISPKMANELSDYRKASIEDDISRGLVVEGKNYEGSNLKRNIVEPMPSDPAGDKLNRGSWQSSSGGISMGNIRNGAMRGSSQTAVGAIAHSKDFVKQGNVSASSGSGIAPTSGSNFERLAPEVYSPMFTMANLNLPRQRVDINAWCRNFFLLHPIVRNAITLHATYPISKLNIKCHDRKVLQFFEDMIEEMDLIGAVGDGSLEYWKHGEWFPYSELDESNGKWSKIVTQNPDYISVKKSPLIGEAVISLRPDAMLQRIVQSNNPTDVKLRAQLSDKIIYHIKRGEDIPLDNFNVSHLKMLSSPYDIRGTSIIVSVFKDLMMYDKVRECHSWDTDVLTESGFKSYENITQEDKIATYNPDTNKIEYHNYLNRVDYEYEGNLINFVGEKIDVKVTPNHKMWLSKQKSHGGYENFDFIAAQDVKYGYFYRAKSAAQYDGKEIEFVEVCGKKIPIEEYLNFLGYLISEGCIYYDEKSYDYSVSANQSRESEYYGPIKRSFEKMGSLLDVRVGEYSSSNAEGFSKDECCDITRWRISRKHITKYFLDEIGGGSHNKKIPRWVKQLSPRLLNVLLYSLKGGDGSIIDSKHKGGATAYRYHTVSKQLADDVQEIVFKCGYAPHLMLDKNGSGTEFYLITWSDSNYGRSPIIYGNSEKNDHYGATIKQVPYKGKVFCFEVPNGLFVTRRNGLISIQGNCKFAQADGLINPITIVKVGGNADGEYRATQEDIELYRQMLEEMQYDKNATLVTHAGITVERVGAAGQVLEISEDMNLIIKNIYTGLMVPPAIVDTESASYATASIGLEVLRQRYFNFRNMMAKWLVNKIFAPISEIQGFYEYKNGKKRLIVPEVEWNQMNLYDLNDYIQQITGLVGSKQVSVQTLYRSLGLNYEEENVKMRQEMIDNSIRQREEQALASMSLSELRTLDPEKEITEAVGEEQTAAMPAPESAAVTEALPELSPPPAPILGPGAGTPEVAGGTPPLGPGTPGGLGL